MFLTRLGHCHSGTLLNFYVLAALHNRRITYDVINRIAFIPYFHGIRKVYGRRCGACVCKNISCLHIIGTEFSKRCEVALHIWYIVIIPKAADQIFVCV